MTHALLIALLTAAAPEVEPRLVAFKIQPIRISVPADFAHTEEGATHRFSAKEGEAFFEVDVGKVQTAGMKGEVCRDKITKGIGGKFTKLVLGGQPAAKKVVTDKNKAKEEFVTHLYVGCDGSTTWSMSFHVLKAKTDQYLPLAGKIAETIQFPKTEEED